MSEYHSQSGISNIIFDFGGVILTISHAKVEKAFLDLGVPNFESLFNQALQTDLFRKFETGRLSSNEFRTQLRSLTGLKISDRKLDNAWNQIIGEYPKERIKILKAIIPYYRLFLLSNTNEIHYDYYIKKFTDEFGFSFQSLFNDTYWSFKKGHRKPDAAAFMDIITEHGIIPRQTLFIDDSVQNTTAAKELGFRTFLINGVTDFVDLFSGEGNRIKGDLL